MTIDEVIRESVVALFSNSILEKTLVLKGGAALHLAEKIDSRLSSDMDFSIAEAIENPDTYFKEVTDVLQNQFGALDYDVIDSRHERKPKVRMEGLPLFWGGWVYTFKLSAKKTRRDSPEARQRSALMPEGSNTTKIEIEISEYEYCGDVEIVRIDGTKVHVYSNILLVLEKLRAICQQHPSYPYGTKKNRARDYYDIFCLVKKYRSSENFYKALKAHIAAVFDAKKVPLDLLDRIFDADFVALQAANFPSVKDTVKESIEEFPFYLEQLRILVSQIQ